MDYKYLSGIKSPSDLKKLNIDELYLLCDEIRDCIIKVVSENGGHLASNLGAVEFTVALHYVFDSPNDAFVFDVGHQSYTHKLLTGRYEKFSTLRKENGVSGFTKPNESEHDLFISGHSSTSISSAYGLLKGREILGDNGKVIAVIGDGAMTGGMFYEAMNNAGKDAKNLIIVLNDNKMSISENVGALARYLTAIRQRNSYFKFKKSFKRFLSRIPLIGGGLRRRIARSKDRLKHSIYLSSNIFEGFGFEYFGPTDGHDLKRIIDLLNIIKKEERPVVLHLTTTKGKGYQYSEEYPDLYHGVSAFNVDEGAKNGNKVDFSHKFGQVLVDLAEENGKICAITAAMPEGTGLVEFSKRFPERFFDVGIAEEHAVTFSAGLAKAGLKPFFAVYSSFAQRTIDQIIHDVAIAGLPVTFCIDRAGFVGADGETHQGLYDIPLLTSIPNLTVYSPSNYIELESLIKKSADSDRPTVIRYPRGCESDSISHLTFSNKACAVIGSGDSVAVTFGIEFANVYNAYLKSNDFEILKLNQVFPIENEVIGHLLSKKKVVVFEESSLSGGIGEKIGALLSKYGFSGDFSIVASNGFVPSASYESDIKKFNLDSDSIIRIMKQEA